MNSTTIIGEVAFYVLVDRAIEGPANYFGGREFDHKIEQTRSHYDRTVGAQKEISRLERHGYDCSKVFIAPVFVTAGQLIKPKIREQKTGFVLQVTVSKDPKAKKGYYGHKEDVWYWKGNKKELITFSYGCGIKGVPQTITASIFKTAEEADAKLKELQDAIVEGIQYHKDELDHAKERWPSSREFAHGQEYVPNDWQLKQIQRTTGKVVKV